MSPAAVDYDALASKYGAAPPVDYDALAQKHGSTNLGIRDVPRPTVDVQPGPPGIVDAMKQSASDIGKQIYHASAPYIAKQIWDHIQGKPSDIRSIPQNAVMAFLSAGGLPEGEAGEMAPARLTSGDAAAALKQPIRGALKPGQYDMPASPLRAPAQLGSGVIEGEYVDAPAPKPKPAIASLKAGVYERPGGFEPNQPALPAKQAIQLPASNPVAPRVAAPTPAPDVSPVTPEAARTGPPLPQTLSGESAFRQVLTGQDNANLLKIARSRGINVAKEAQLKPGVADNLLVNKIIDDMSPEELDNMRDTYLESTRNRAQLGDIGPEAWKTLSLKTYFPNLKIPAAVLKRTASAVQDAMSQSPSEALGKMPPSSDDLTEILQASLKKAKAGKR